MRKQLKLPPRLHALVQLLYLPTLAYHRSLAAYAAGMAVASSKAIDKIKNYSRRITTIFSPIFFALAGAEFNFRSFITSDVFFYVFFVALVIVAIVGKVAGCGGSAYIFLKDKGKSLKVGIGMISRGEVGLIVAGVAITSGAITQSIYSAIIGMIMITTIITPILLKVVYDRSAKSARVPEPQNGISDATSLEENER